MKKPYLVYLLAAIFLLSGSAKILSLPFELAAFERWGYPLWFMYATGVAEVIGAVMLLGPWRRWTAAALAALMVGAVTTHIVHQEWPMMVLALGILMACVQVFRWQISNHLGDANAVYKPSP